MEVRKAYAERRKPGPTARFSPSSCKLLPTTNLAVGPPPELALQALSQCCRDGRRHQARDIAAEDGYLLDPARPDEAVVRGGEDVEGLDLRRQVAVELVHLELVLEVGYGTKSLHDRGGAVLAGELDEQHGERRNHDVSQPVIGDRLLDEALALRGVEQGGPLPDRLVDDAHDDAVEHPRRPPDDVQVAVRDRVVGSRADSDAPIAHADAPSWIVTRVSP